MRKAKRLAIFGAGNIGTEARERLLQEGYQVAAVITSKFLRTSFSGDRPIGQVFDVEKLGAVAILENIERHAGEIDCYVSAIPGGDGTFEDSIMGQILPAGKSFVTAAKVALAKYFERHAPYLSQIGRNATVGGGTMMLDFMRKHLRLDDGAESDVHLVINGTLSFAMSNRWKNRPMEAILHDCIALKYAEPVPKGEKPDGRKIFNGEIDDQLWKLLIILNDIYRERIGRFVTMADLKVSHLDERAYQMVTGHGSRRKFVVRITTSEREQEIKREAKGSIWANIDNKVFVCGGFYDIPYGSALAQWVPDVGPGNAVQIEQAGKTVSTSGDGAGPTATGESIVHDVKQICPL